MKNKEKRTFKISKKKKQTLEKRKLGSWFHIIKNIHDWDYIYCLDLEYYYLKRLKNLIHKNNSFVGCERTCEQIQTIINLLELIRKGEDGLTAIYDENSSIRNVIKKCTFKKNRYINTRNASRFINSRMIEKMNNCKDDLILGFYYSEKLWKIYHTLRENWMRNFWD